MAVILAFILVFISSFFIMLKVGRNKLKKSLAVDESLFTELFDEADIYRDGKSYYYNDDLVNILILGVDQDQADNKEVEGQADAVYLLSADVNSHVVNVFCISRNTMVDMDILDLDGNPYGKERRQICLSYAYGRNDRQSSENTARSVSRLLMGVPINGYYTFHMDCIADLVTSVGGVEVSVSQDVAHLFPGYRVGDLVTLGKDNVLPYIRYREESNAPRLERQKVFITNFINQAKSAVKKNWSLPLDLYNKLAQKSVTDIGASSAVYLATQAVDATFNMINLPGTSGFDGQYETFDVDEDALYELVFTSFFREK